MPIVSVVASADSYISSFATSTNYSTATGLVTGEPDLRTLVGFDLTGYAGATLSAAPTLRIRDATGFEPSTVTVWGVTRAVVGSQVTWASWSTGNAWATAGGTGAGDRTASSIGSGSFGVGVGVRSISLDQATVQAALGGTLWLMVTAGVYLEFASVETATPAELEIDYSLAADEQPVQQDDDTLQAWLARTRQAQAAFLSSIEDEHPVGPDAAIPTGPPQQDDDTLQAWLQTLARSQAAFLAAIEDHCILDDATGAETPLSGAGLAHDQALTIAELASGNVAAPAPSTHDHALSTAALSTRTALGGAALTHTATLATASLSTGSVLSPAASTHAQTLAAATLVTRSTVASAAAAHAQPLTPAAVSTTGAASVAPAAAAHALTLTTADTTTATSLTLAPAAHLQALAPASTSTTGAATLTPAQAAHGHTAAPAPLTVRASLVAALLQHASALGAVVVQAAGSVAVLGQRLSKRVQTALRPSVTQQERRPLADESSRPERTSMRRPANTQRSRR